LLTLHRERSKKARNSTSAWANVNHLPEDSS
jgi:hypothetical protein